MTIPFLHPVYIQNKKDKFSDKLNGNSNFIFIGWNIPFVSSFNSNFISTRLENKINLIFSVDRQHDQKVAIESEKKKETSS
jgi:hypothetical protein